MINEAGKPKLKTPVVPDLPPEKLWVKKTFYYHPETVEKLELLKVKISAKNGKKIFIQELIDEALEMLFKKYDV